MWYGWRKGTRLHHLCIRAKRRGENDMASSRLRRNKYNRLLETQDGKSAHFSGLSSGFSEAYAVFARFAAGSAPLTLTASRWCKQKSCSGFRSARICWISGTMKRHNRDESPTTNVSRYIHCQPWSNRYHCIDWFNSPSTSLNALAAVESNDQIIVLD